MTKKITILVLCFMIVGGNVLLVLSPDNVEAVVLSYESEAALDGSIGGIDQDNYTEALNGIGDLFLAVTDEDFLGVSNSWSWGPANYIVARAFMSFDTSTLPDDFIIGDVTLNFRLDSTDCSDLHNIQIYNTEYGDTLTTDDWNNTGSFEASFGGGMCYPPGIWLHLSVSPVNINLTGRTQYVFRHSLEGIAPPTPPHPTGHLSGVYISSSDSAYKPYLTIDGVANTGAIVTYNYTAPGMSNYTTTVYPAEVIDWNNTYDQLRYEVFLYNESYAHFTVNETFIFQSYNPWLNVTDMGNGTYNLTQSILDFEFHHLWFLREKSQPKTRIHIALWHDTVGVGFFWNYWKVVICDGPAYDNTSYTWIPNSDYTVDYGGNYTIAVLDYFDSFIVDYTFTANSQDMDILIGVPVYALQVINYRCWSSVLSIWFNATGDPYTHTVPGNTIHYLPVHEGNYMLRISYLSWNNQTQTETLDGSFYYNITIDADYNFYVSESMIITTYFAVNGLEIQLNTLTTWVTPGVVVDPDNPALCPTNSDSGTGELENTLDPWLTVTTTVRVSGQGTGSLWAGELDTATLGGSVTFLGDTLFISADNTTATMYVNNTGGAEVFNESAPWGIEYDILNDHYSSRGDNLTVTVTNGSFFVLREIKFRWERLFTWYMPAAVYYTAAISVNNSLDLDFIAPEVFVAFANNTNPDQDSVRVKDLDNNYYLSSGQGYGVDNSGVRFMFANLTSGGDRRFLISYYKANSTYYGIKWIDPEAAPQWVHYNNRNMRYLYGSWQNQEAKTFLGEVRFIIGYNEGRYIDDDSLIVKDRNTQKEIPKNYWEFTGTTVDIDPAYIGDVGPQDSVSIGVYYLNVDEAQTSILTDPVFMGLSWPWLLAAISFLGIILGAILLGGGYFKKIKGKRGDAIRSSGVALIEVGLGLLIVDFLTVIVIVLTSGSGNTASIILNCLGLS